MICIFILTHNGLRIGLFLLEKKDMDVYISRLILCDTKKMSTQKDLVICLLMPLGNYINA